MMALYLISLALAHGGEDHGAPPPSAASSDATSVRVTASSKLFEAVVSVNRGPAGSAVPTTLLLDDFATSAPVSDATPSLALQGPAPVEIAFSPTSSGTYTGSASFPSEGEYAGVLVVTTPAVADLLPISGLRLGDSAAPDAVSTGLKVLGALGGVAVIVLGALVTLGVGYAIGRRKGASAAAALLACGIAAQQVQAHGGEDHGSAPGATARDTSGALHLPMESQFLVGLRTQPLVRESFQESVPALGRFVARAGGGATLRSPAAGELAAPSGGFPLPGAEVRAGQILATVRGAVGSADQAALAEARQQAATAVAEAKKALALAERDAAQAGSLAGAISDRDRLERQQSIGVARTALAEAERALAAIGDGMGITIRAPVAGRLGPALARPGDQVQAGDALFRVVDATGLWLEARVPERLAAGITAGAAVAVVSTAFPDASLSAIILDAGQEADPATGSFTVTLAVDAAGLDLHPGMSATAWLVQGPARDALVVPDAAVVDSNGLMIGFIKVGPEQFELRELKLGTRSNESWEVFSGLKAGERVVIDGTYTLRSLAGR